MQDKYLRWGYTFILLLLTLGWAAFVMLMVRWTTDQPNATNIVELSGTSAVLGALIVWNGNVNQFWFRKKPNETEVKDAEAPKVP